LPWVEWVESFGWFEWFEWFEWAEWLKRFELGLSAFGGWYVVVVSAGWLNRVSARFAVCRAWAGAWAWAWAWAGMWE
jgi:hypothetical protein